MMTRRLQLLMLLVTLWNSIPATAAGVNAWLDRTHIAAGETVQLTLEIPGQVTAQPETAPLERDFDVLGVSSGSRMTIINGRSDASTRWTITLSPRHDGTLTVPALRVGGARSEPLTLEVSTAPAPQAGSDADILVETELSTHQPYVQGQVLYTIRLLHAVPVRSGQLSEPASDAVLVQKLGDDRDSVTTRHGRRYQVIERRYALFPQASGELTLAAPVFDGEIPDAERRRPSPFSKFFGNDPFFGRDPFDDLLTPTRRVRVRGEPARLDVQPRPSAAAQGGHWLPAQRVELHGDWQPASDEVHAGEPVTLQLDIEAQGLTGGQLPGLAPAAADGFDVYPDQAQRQTDTNETGVTGRLQQKIAFIPRHAGELTLPPVEVRWWDTRADRARVASVPGRVVQVLPGSQPARPASPAAASGAPASAPASSADAAPAAAPAAPPPAAAASPWPWVSAALAAGWLLTLLGWWWRARRARAVVARGQPPATTRPGALRRRFHAACAADDAVTARRTLLEWAASHWPEDPPRGLQALAQRIDDPEARSALAGLDRAIYRAESDWEGARLAACLPQLPVVTRAGTGRSVLAPLYPEPTTGPRA